MTVELTARFRALHAGPGPLLMANAWDLGSAHMLAELGFAALATTSSGLAWSLGRSDGEVDRAAVLDHAATLAAAVGLPVSADLEDGYGEEPADAAGTVAAAVRAGLAGASIEDFDPRRGRFYDIGHARAKVEAAAEAAHRGPGSLVLTARAENFVRGSVDLDDAIRRLQAYQEAGADVLYAPGITTRDQIERVVAAVDRPVNVLLTARTPPVPVLAELGVARVSVGGALAAVAYAAARDAARVFRDAGVLPAPPTTS
jgi:2-methylisocitrate lyase-like PEP mutase family enzyme